MRHGKRTNSLSRKKGHRVALMRNLASALIEHKRINTTLAKAKALRRFIEPLLTRSKSDTTHNRRVCFNQLQNKEAVKTLFDEISEKVADRPGGYVRIIRTGFRKGDNAEMAMIELVDFNEIYTSEERKKTRRSRTRRGGGRSRSKPTASATTRSSSEEE